jgi:hypothetical protein
MIEYYRHIDNFWSEALSSYEFPQRVSLDQRNYFHPNYKDSSNDLLQGFDDELPSVCQQFYTALNITQGSMSWTCIRPGNTIPTHSDNFYKLRLKYNVDVSQCVRYLIFLEDWKLGHFVEFQECIITKWKSGDVWRFDVNSMHCAANASNSNFYSCQVNTIIDNDK